MRWGLLALTCASCSFTFVKEPNDAMLKGKAPLTCTTSRALPLTDLAIGAVLGGLVFATTYVAVESFNDEPSCQPNGCYRAWGPALIGSFLVVSPWGISSAVGFSETGDCRKAVARAPAPVR